MTLLILAGTGDARRIAQALYGQGVSLIASLAGATRAPRPLAVPTRTGGFGGGAGFAEFLKAENITAVLDATHPFAARISERSHRICRDLSVPYALFLRPAWEPQDGDRWTLIDREEEAANFIPPKSVVFLATGRQTLPRFANLSACWLICRQIDAADGAFPFPNGRYLIGNPPFSQDEEIKLFQKHSVDWLVVKNAGGEQSASKLAAARALNIPVAMIRRPAPPSGLILTREQDAIAWARDVHG